MKRVALLAALLLASAPPAAAQLPRHAFALGDSTFLLDGRPIQLVSGELHYARIPREYWRHRLRMAKAMGLNAIATYVFWNYHEPRPGVFDFRTGNRDLAAFLRIAQEEGLWVILRPGPYACAEWEFGGYPWWLLKERDLLVRSRDPRFLEASRRYVNALADQVRDLQVTHGGPVIMVQIENEYGSYGEDTEYKEAHHRMLVDAGIDVPLFTSDGDWLFHRGAIPGVLPTANGEMRYDSLVRRVNAYHGGRGPYMVAEFYPGWLMHWAEPFPVTPTDSFLPQYEGLIARGASVNLYMFHGGTNFGFTTGANYTREIPIQPSLTSYDYDAPLSEAGWPTPKYYAIREAIRRHVPWAIPDVPDSLPVITIPAVRMRPGASVFDLLEGVEGVRAEAPLSFEDLDQESGYVLYRRVFTQAAGGMLEVEGLRDYALVFVDGRRVGVLDRHARRFAGRVDVPRGGRLDILVENLGRINYGADMVNNRKGIIGPVMLGGAELSGWTMYRLPFAGPVRASLPHATGSARVPTVYRGSFTLERVGDTFLDLRGWGKGIVFVNGVNLGRYWHVGPQQTLYLPGAWLRRGRNEVEIFEQLNDSVPGTVSGLARPILTELRPNGTRPG
jgi:beta-galactosidase